MVSEEAKKGAWMFILAGGTKLPISTAQYQWRPHEEPGLSSIPSSNKATLLLHTGVVSEEAYGELELSCLHDVNGSHVRSSSKVPPCIQGGIRRGFVKSWNVHLHPAVIRSEAKWRT